MAVFAISDLHLSINAPSKSMEFFGDRWIKYAEKIENNWNKVVGHNDTVIIPGDISWASSLEDALSDLEFLNALPGKKIISKGNHDFWWSTAKKIGEFFAAHSLDTLSILYNDAIIVEDYIITGTRGWFADPSQQVTMQPTDYKKIVNRENIRLTIALEHAKRLKEDNPDKEMLAFFHFPLIWKDFCNDESLALLSSAGVSRVYYGHIHSQYNVPEKISWGDMSLSMISADYLNFIPKLI